MEECCTFNAVARDRYPAGEFLLQTIPSDRRCMKISTLNKMLSDIELVLFAFMSVGYIWVFSEFFSLFIREPIEMYFQSRNVRK